MTRDFVFLRPLGLRLPVAKSIHHDGRIVEKPLCEAASGYSVIKAESLNKALELAKGCPILHKSDRSHVVL